MACIIAAMAVKQRGMAEFLDRFGIGAHRAAGESGLTAPTIYNLISGRSIPSLITVQKILDFARRYDPEVTFEQLFAEDLSEAAPETAEVASAWAGGGRHA